MRLRALQAYRFKKSYNALNDFLPPQNPNTYDETLAENRIAQCKIFDVKKLYNIELVNLTIQNEIKCDLISVCGYIYFLVLFLECFLRSLFDWFLTCKIDSLKFWNFYFIHVTAVWNYTIFKRNSIENDPDINQFA